MTPFFKGFLIRLLEAIAAMMLALWLLSLAGCATGVSVNDEERIACRNDGCVVYTAREERDLVRRAVEAGYRKGWGDAVRQAIGGGL